MRTYLLITGLLLMIIHSNLNAQDKIIKTNKDTIICQVKEISTDEIKYILPEISTEVLFGIDKNEVMEVIFQNGKVLTFSHSLYGSESYENQKKKALKVEFLAPLTGNTTFSYEQLIKPTKSWEATIGIIGVGIDPNDYNPRGAFAKFGIKYIKSPNFYLKGMRYAHILKGAYWKPEIAFSAYSYEPNEYWDFWDTNSEENRKTNYVFAFNLNIGKQWVFDDVFLIDWYMGLGYGFGKIYRDHSYHYGFSGADSDVPLTFNAGLKIGLLFK